jgi:penicillin-binding protein A
MQLFKKDSPGMQQPSWREYQDRYGRRRSRRFSRSRPKPWPVMAVAATLVILIGLLYTGLTSSSTAPAPGPKPKITSEPALREPALREPASPASPASNDNADLMSRKDVQVLLSQVPVDRLIEKQTSVPFKGHQLLVDTSLDMDLQSYLVEKMDRKNSRYIGIVVMEADTGRILVLAGFDKTNPTANPCLRSTFPSASLFKMVTAAAAVDHFGYQPDTPVHFNGYKHTLYRSQIKDVRNKYTVTLSFKNAFAQSVNPVFGKIGALRLGRENLEQTADAFGFNQPIDFELAVAPSHFSITDDPYNWAEMASGFNNDTTISPLHGAMMVSAVLNGGRIIAPTIIDRISDEHGKPLYRSEPEWQGRAMSAKAATALTNMMRTTVLAGTGRRVFRGIQRNRTLSHLQIGGKTGSIYNRAHDARFDWFIGFAEEKGSRVKLAVSVMVAHEEYIGIRAGRYARMAMTRFFENQLAQHTTATKSAGS